jgi:hypothetical protein
MFLCFMYLFALYVSRNEYVRWFDIYESVTASRYVKRVQPSLLMQTPQDPTESVSMTESFILTLCFNTLHVCFHVDGLELHQ